MDDLMAFLRARIDEDDVFATALAEECAQMGPVIKGVTENKLYELMRETALRTRSEVSVKRAILNHWPDPFGNWTADQADAARTTKEHILRSLAAAYRFHPGYRDEWKPFVDGSPTRAPVWAVARGDLITVNRAGREPVTRRASWVEDHGDGSLTVHIGVLS